MTISSTEALRGLCLPTAAIPGPADTPELWQPHCMTMMFSVLWGCQLLSGPEGTLPAEK